MSFSKVKSGPFGTTPIWKAITGICLLVLAVPLEGFIALNSVGKNDASNSQALDTSSVVPEKASATERENQISAVTAEEKPVAAGQSMQVDNEVQSSQVDSAKYTAILTCRIENAAYPVNMCLVGGSNQTAGSLKIVNGDSVKQYADTEVLELFDNTSATFNLRGNFQILAQVIQSLVRLASCA